MEAVSVEYVRGCGKGTCAKIIFSDGKSGVYKTSQTYVAGKGPLTEDDVLRQYNNPALRGSWTYYSSGGRRRTRKSRRSRKSRKSRKYRKYRKY
jgi:hypothetical protein